MPKKSAELEERGNWLVVGGALLGFAALIVIGATVRPSLPASDTTSIALPVALLIGLTAGGLSCLAVQGGLLTVAVTGERALPGEKSVNLAGYARPILWFLGAKLVAYTALGAVLGALGEAIAPSAELRSAVQIATALLMGATALYFLGAHPIFRFAILQPPHALTRRISKTARSDNSFAPAMLGAMTVFLPCGVTLAMQLVAINSSSPVAGAAIMGAFVLGTAPLFFSLGYVASSFSDRAQRRFLQVAGVAILALAILGLDAGLRLGGSPVTLATVKDALIKPPAPVPSKVAPDGTQTVQITAGSDGYIPRVAVVKAGKPTRITFTSDGSYGCWLALIFLGKEYLLNPDKPVIVDIPPMAANKSINYACGMGMSRGRIEAAA